MDDRNEIMPETTESPLARIHALATAALATEGCPAAIARSLEEIVALSDPHHGDTPEASDTPDTENQSL